LYVGGKYIGDINTPVYKTIRKRWKNSRNKKERSKLCHGFQKKVKKIKKKKTTKTS
jgi:hypothetical protein